jgi:hypothetical protein
MIHSAEWQTLRAAAPEDDWWIICWNDDLSPRNKAALAGVRVSSI